MKFRLNNISIKKKIYFYLLILIIYPVTILLTFGYTNFYKILYDRNIERMNNDSWILSSSLKDKLDELYKYSRTILYDNTIFTDGERALRDIITLQSQEFEDSTNTYMSGVVYSNENIDGMKLIYFNAEGSSKPFLRCKNTIINNALSVTSDLEELALDSGGIPAWKVKNDEVYLVKLIKSQFNSQKKAAILIFMLNKEKLFRDLDKYILLNHENIRITSEDGTLLYSRELFDEDDMEVINIQSRPEENMVFRTVNSAVYKLSIEMENIGWNFELSISSTEIYKNISDIWRIIAIMCILSIPIGLLVIELTSYDILKPLNLIINSMKKVKKGEFDTKIEVDRGDEIGYLYKSFNEMSAEINRLINGVYEVELTKKESEIKSLESQMNPHFINNTLEIINWTALMNGVDDISTMVKALSSIMEDNINRTGENFVYIKKELEHIQNFITIMRLRYGERIRFIIEVDNICKEYEIPKFILQPLLENAVYHGVENKIDGGEIKLSIRSLDENLFISVSDDGVGMSQHKLETLRESFNNNLKIEENDRTSIGLFNVNKRIKLLYGLNYGLNIESIIQQGTKITISLPIYRNEVKQGV